jgi:hypothetical protein
MNDNSDQDHPLANKVDALLSRHNPPAGSTADRNIPVLTDLVEAPAWQPTRSSEPATRSAQGASAPSEADIEQLSVEIFSRVSQRIDTELAANLEARLSERIHAHLSTTVSHVLADMKQSIANEIGDAINATLADRLRK